MAKKTVNKSQAIRDAMAAHPDKSPKELSEILKGQGLKIPPTYISAIKSNMKARKGKRGRKKTKALKGSGGPSSNGLMAAVEFVKASGGLEGAKAALKTVEEIARLGAASG